MPRVEEQRFSAALSLQTNPGFSPPAFSCQPLTPALQPPVKPALELTNFLPITMVA